MISASRRDRPSGRAMLGMLTVLIEPPGHGYHWYGMRRMV
jgi:hypothetical protein